MTDVSEAKARAYKKELREVKKLAQERWTEREDSEILEEIQDKLDWVD